MAIAEILHLLLIKNVALTGTLIGFSGLVIVFIIYILSLILNKPVNLDMKFVKLNFEGRKRKNDTAEQIKKILSLTDYISNDDTLIEIIVDKTKEKTEEKDIIIFKESITKQMVSAEDTNIIIKSLMSSKYAELLESKLKVDEDVRTQKDYRYYQIIVSSILEEIKRKTLKESLKNDLLGLSDKEWDDFVDMKSDTMIAVIFEYLDLMYNSRLVSRNELSKMNKSIEECIIKEYKLMYKRIRTIIKEDDERIKKIQSELNDEIKEVKQNYHDNSPIKKIEDIIKDVNITNE